DIKAAVKQGVAHGMRAMVKGQGVTGISILAIEEVEPLPAMPELDYTPQHIYIPSTPGQFTRMLESIEASLQNIQHLDFAGVGQGVTNVLAGVRKLTDKIDRLDLQSITTNVNEVLVEAKTTVGKVEDTLTEVRQSIKGMKLESVSQHAD